MKTENKIASPKRIICSFLLIIMFITFVGCGNGSNEMVTEKNIFQNVRDDLYYKAIAILEELDDDPRIKNFLKAYNLLMSLPSNTDKFIAQLEDANEIFQKYGMKLHYGDYYLGSHATLTEENIQKYQTKGAFYDAMDLLEALVYPVLFSKYGSTAQSIDGITANEVISAIQSTHNCILDNETERYDGYTQTWRYKSTPKSDYSVSYHKNGLVESVTVPIVRSEHPLDNNEFEAYHEMDLPTQKQMAGRRYMSMMNQLGDGYLGGEVLSQIFTQEEINIIFNYIQSLTLEDIWTQNVYAFNEEEPTTYNIATVWFDYKGTLININWDLNDITLDISSKDYVNALSHRWYILWVGLCLGQATRNNLIDDYSDYLNNNTAINSIVNEFSFDLDANAHKFQNPTTMNPQPSVPDTLPTVSNTQQEHYAYAETLLASQNYLSAASQYKLAGNYADAATKILECYYLYGKAQLALNYVTEATQYLSMCRGYKDTDEILLSYYYAEAKDAFDYLISSYSTYEFTTTIDNAFTDTQNKLALCEEYKDSALLMKIAEKTYEAWDNIYFDSNCKVNLNNMSVSYTGNIITITKSRFWGEADLTLTYDITKETFSASIKDLFYTHSWESDVCKTLCATIRLFTAIENTDDLYSRMNQERNWSVSDTTEDFHWSYGGYNISINSVKTRYSYIDDLTIVVDK